MAPRAGVAYAEIVPKLAEGFAGDLQKQFTGPVEESGGKVGASLGKVAGLIGGAFAAKGIFDFGRSAVEAATESNKIAAQTEAALKSTGAAAHVTAGQVGELATAISNKTGIDDEAIQKGANLLLTFTNVRNEAGKGNDVFNQSTKVLTDMSAALGTDVSGSAIQLGKALNDPVKGLTALSRVGVSFTEEQKAQIKELAGAAGAHTQVAASLDKHKAKLAELEAAGKGATKEAATLRVQIQGQEGDLKSLGAQMKDGTGLMQAQKIILGELSKELGGSAEAQATAGDRLKVTWGNVQEDIGNMLLPMLNKVATFLADNLPKAFAAVSGAIDKVKPFIADLTKGFGEGGLGGAIGVLKDKFVAAWPAIETALGNILSGIGKWITGKAIPYLREQFPVWIAAMWEWIKKVTPPALQALADLAAALGKWLIETGLPLLGEKLVELGKALWHWIQDATPPALAQLVDWLAQLGSWILTDGIPKLVGFLANMGAKLLGWISDIVPQLPGKLGEFLGKFAAWIVTDGIPKLIEMGGKMGGALMGFLEDAAKAAPSKIGDIITAIAGWLRDKGPGLVGDAVKLITAAIEAPFKLVFNTIAGFWNNTVGKISFSVPSWVPGLGGKGFDFPKIPTLHEGGVVPGTPGADVLAVLQAGEFVLPRRLADLPDFKPGRPAAPNTVIDVGGIHMQGTVTAADLSEELGWLRRTSGR